MNRETPFRLVLLTASILTTMVISEIVLGILFPAPGRYYVWPPHLHQVFHPRPDIMPGLSSPSRFITNSEGIRGDEPSQHDTYKILAVGGSTTECLYLDQDVAWPALVEKELNRDQNRRKVWIGNVGRSGLNSRHHRIQLEYLLPDFPSVDAILLLEGVNDLNLRLARDRQYDPRFLERPDAEEILLGKAFALVPPSAQGDLPFYKRTALWRFGGRVRRALSPPPPENQDDSGMNYLRWRSYRKEARVVRQDLPDLDSAIQEYRNNLHAILEISRRRSIRVVFVSQPVLWRADLPRALRDLLWFGGVGDFQKGPGHEYYSVAALARGMDRFNEAMRETCKTEQVECVDLTPLLPQDSTVFYDDVHFNVGGSEKVARILARYLLQRPPFAGPKSPELPAREPPPEGHRRLSG